MSRAPAILVVIILLFASGCDSTEDESYEMDISNVPEVVLAAAREAVPGLVVRYVEREQTRSGVVYEVYGVANGRYYEIKVREDGTVIEIELEDDDD